MNRYEKQLKAVEENIRTHVAEFQSIYKKADDEDRDPSQDERLEVESHLKAIETLKLEKADAEANIKVLADTKAIGDSLGTSVSVTSEPQDRFIDAANKAVFPQAQQTIGEKFISSEGYQKAIRQYKADGGRFQEGFSTGAVMMTKGTLEETAGFGGIALATPVPQVVPGVVEKLFQKLTFADLLLQGQATTSSIRYVSEGTATSAAAGVLEAGTKPESTLGLITTDEPIRKIATVLPVSDEMLEDAPQVAAYINGRLSLFVRIEEERQLFRGTTSSEVSGMFNRSLPVYAGGTAVGNYAVQLFAAVNGVRGSAFVEPDFIVIHPTDWQKLRLLTDTAGQFFGGGPFQGEYGNGRVIGQSGQVVGPTDQVWNIPTYVTAGIGNAGTALIGTSDNAQVWRRGGLSVEATNSHSTYFTQNLVAIRAEERLGLAVYRTGAFCEVHLA